MVRFGNKSGKVTGNSIFCHYNAFRLDLRRSERAQK